ncbi:MAG: ABC transporter permease, partial [Bryobacteraceae bacterium]
MWERIIVILRKEFIQVLREPRMRALLFIPPLLQLIIFGYAVTLDVDNARIGWMDNDGTPESRALLARFQGSGRFEIVATPHSEAEVQSVLDRGQAHAVVCVLPNFARDLARGRTAEVQVLVDGSNSNTAALVSAYAEQVIASFAGDAQPGQTKNRQTIKLTARGPGQAPVMTSNLVTADTRVWFNPDLRSRNYFVPGVAVNILFMVTLTLTAQAIIREKEIGTMEQLMVTPMRPIELMLGKTLPFALIGLVDLVLVTAGALLIFRVPFRGSFLVLFFSATLFLLTSLGAGLYLSTISRTQQQANMASFFFSSPAFMLSGFNFP